MRVGSFPARCWRGNGAESGGGGGCWCAAPSQRVDRVGSPTCFAKWKQTGSWQGITREGPGVVVHKLDQRVCCRLCWNTCPVIKRRVQLRCVRRRRTLGSPACLLQQFGPVFQKGSNKCNNGALELKRKVGTLMSSTFFHFKSNLLVYGARQ